MNANGLLTELLSLIESGQVRIQPYTLDDTERPPILAKINDWIGRAKIVEISVDSVH